MESVSHNERENAERVFHNGRESAEQVFHNERKIVEYISRSERETEEIGAALARNLRPGSAIAFRGGLGMGKTAFVRGLARGLGYPGRVTSPTFTIVNEYEGGRLPLFHFDLYRLGGAGELWDLGWDEYQERGGICAAEWSERAEELFPNDALFVALERGPDGDSSRRITISGRKGDLTDGASFPSPAAIGADRVFPQSADGGADGGFIQRAAIDADGVFPQSADGGADGGFIQRAAIDADGGFPQSADGGADGESDGKGGASA